MSDSVEELAREIVRDQARASLRGLYHPPLAHLKADTLARAVLDRGEKLAMMVKAAVEMTNGIYPQSYRCRLCGQSWMRDEVKHAPTCALSNLPASVTARLEEMARLRRENAGEREARNKLDNALREKDAAMGVLFKRLIDAGVDCSDLIP